MRRDRTGTERNGSRTRRQRTVSISLQNRGQTTQDFAIGIGVFILAIAFVFSFLPTILTPFDSSASGGQTAQADRIADHIVNDSEDGNELDWEEDVPDEEDFAGEFGLRESDDIVYDRVNVTLEEFETDQETIADSGNDYDDQSAASSSRTVSETDKDCDPCRLVVRVW
ncbi:DUF7287 family protein [Natronorubrum daqingense]|uniref:Uncharacterized protein n=1 Tax=Natronorubrum daqingense TaxID=588898 RepID=A0A1N6Z694_9EURY|nr:hypothetical protein [Natronorubrum daqingense]APX95446.1 hypothetical protein BB347_01800 [Natronorubrum daqingense]SIR22333.1 hypothetical protein SAMN05421809_0694 [Natronorubrum daqingense]